MAEVWKSKDLTVELGATDIAGVYNLAIKSPYIEIRDLDGNPIRNRVVERSFGISKVPYITDHGSTVYDRYMEIYKEAIPEGYADYCLHGYFASWAKNISFDRDSGCNIVTRNWTINKIFKLKNLGSGSASYDFDEPSDSGILTTGKGIEEVTFESLKKIVEDDTEIISIYYGSDIEESVEHRQLNMRHAGKHPFKQDAERLSIAGDSLQHQIRKKQQHYPSGIEDQLDQRSPLGILGTLHRCDRAGNTGPDVSSQCNIDALLQRNQSGCDHRDRDRSHR